MRQKKFAARDENSVGSVDHMAALSRPVKGRAPNCDKSG
jgi:hypothetical protein